jgi:hypothetical protein
MKDFNKRLAEIALEISRLREEVAILGEQLAFQRDVLDDTRVRALVAETPLADREFRIAAEDFRRIERGMGDAERRMVNLRTEQDRLLAGLFTTGAEQ